MNELAQELYSDKSCGPAVTEKLASVVNKMLQNKISEEKLKDKQSLKTVIILMKFGRSYKAMQDSDIRMQKVQSLLLKRLMPINLITHTIFNWDNTQFDEAKTTEVIRDGLDAVSLFSQANFELNLRRREIIKPDLNHKFQQLCAYHTPCTNQLLEDDLNKPQQEIT